MSVEHLFHATVHCLRPGVARTYSSLAHVAGLLYARLCTSDFRILVERQRANFSPWRKGWNSGKIVGKGEVLIEVRKDEYG